ncbi:LOW QUALITY PROTEIN: hypothetical protein M513_04891 [Trichuris suis]|uniref:DNA repair protein RAD51 homolog 3 n=1 Tax=Trichuris suis TaxID=68888 RepID=A0A085MA68_9BILA|nr:LOW QUALITY PROTEIN: hypothetical protein M513_04891 [Trichuris suis]
MSTVILRLSLQLAVDARIPETLGGVDGEVVYIDTECTFRIGRLEQIARFAIDHCTSTAESESRRTVSFFEHYFQNVFRRCTVQRSALENFTMEKILSGIYVQRCTDLNGFRRCVHLLQEFVSANKKVKLIVVDSIATHLREQFASAIERNHVVQSVILQLLSVALRFNTAIFLTNQVTTKWTKYGESYTAPCLGPILTSNCSHQLFVYKKRGSTRYIRLIKSTTGGRHTRCAVGTIKNKLPIYLTKMKGTSGLVITEGPRRTGCTTEGGCKGGNKTRFPTGAVCSLIGPKRTTAAGDDEHCCCTGGTLSITGCAVLAVSLFGKASTTTTSSRVASYSTSLGVKVTDSSPELLTSSDGLFPMVFAKASRGPINRCSVRSSKNKSAVSITSSIFFTDSGTDSLRSLLSKYRSIKLSISIQRLTNDGRADRSIKCCKNTLPVIVKARTRVSSLPYVLSSDAASSSKALSNGKKTL